MNKNGKQYGLVVPKKAQLSTVKAGNVFGNDEDSDEEDSVDWVKKALKAEGEKNRIKKQVKLNMAKALNEDPTIYQYDEIYDDLERNKEKSKADEQKQAKKPKYIHNLLKAADRRKREQEHRIERMVQKEREAEGEMYSDKESFVTSAYRAKLEEFKKMEEEDARMDRLESIGDVTKQQDMSGFYRQLFAQTVDGQKIDDEASTTSTSKLQYETEKEQCTNQDNDTSQSDSESESENGSNSEADNNSQNNSNENTETIKTISKVNKKRQYRKRNVEQSESESDDDQNEKINENQVDEHTPIVEQHETNCNDELESSNKKIKLNQDNDDNNEKSKNNHVEPEQKQSKLDNNNQIDDKKNSEKMTVETKKISIWEKRTVGPVYETALERYYARKALASAS